jgi:hypothetical protein
MFPESAPNNMPNMGEADIEATGYSLVSNSGIMHPADLQYIFFAEPSVMAGLSARLPTLPDFVYDVVSMRPQEEVFWVHAPHIVASVQDAGIIRYLSTIDSPGPSVSMISFPFESKRAISVNGYVALPFPTPIAANQNLPFESFLERSEHAEPIRPCAGSIAEPAESKANPSFLHSVVVSLSLKRKTTILAGFG